MATVESPTRIVHGPRVWPLSVKAYHALAEMALIPENTELLYGQIIQKMAKSPFHSYLQQCLTDAIQGVLPSGTYLRSEQPITCTDSEPEPDLAVVRGCKEDYRHEHPRTATLVIEVCVTSHDYDRSKIRAYACAGVEECWLVLGPEKQIEVYGQPAGDHFAERSLHGPGGMVVSNAIRDLAVDLDALFKS